MESIIRLASSGMIFIAPPLPPPATIGLKAYSDSQATIDITTLEWGQLDKGSSIYWVAYLKNTGNTNGVISMTATNWNSFEAASAITFSWNSENILLESGKIKQVTFALKTKADIVATIPFSFDIVITITGV